MELMTFEQFCDRLILDGVYQGEDSHLYRPNKKPVSRKCLNGYWMTRVRYDGHNYNFMEHRVVWYMHNHYIDPDKEINHIDFNRENNNISNLELVTRKENMRWSVINGRMNTAKGEKSGKSILTNAQAQAIRYLYQEGFLQERIANLFQIPNRNTVSRIVTRKRYDCVPDAETVSEVYEEVVKAQLKSVPAIKDEKDALLCCSIGLASECGEFSDIVIKSVFQGHDFDEIHAISEMGDIMFYLCGLASLMGISFKELMAENLAKVKRRYPNGYNNIDSINRKENDV